MGVRVIPAARMIVPGLDGLFPEINAVAIDTLDRGIDMDLHAGPILERASRILRERRINLGQNSIGSVKQMEANLVAIQATVIPKNLINEGRQLAEDFDADQSAADDGEGKELLPAHRVGLDIGAFESLNDMIPHGDCIRQRFKGKGKLRARDTLLIRLGAESQHEVVIRQPIDLSLGSRCESGTSFKVDTIDRGFDKVRVPQEVADRDRTMPKFERSGHCLEEQRSHQKKVVTVEQRDLHVGVLREQLLEFFSGKDPTEPATEYEDLGGGFVWHNDSRFTRSVRRMKA